MDIMYILHYVHNQQRPSLSFNFMDTLPNRVSMTSLLSATTITDLKLESPGSTRVEGKKHEES